MNSERRILVYKDYFLTFYRTLEAGAQKKIDYVLDVLKMQDRVSEKFVKYIKDGLYEIRASYNGNIYRAFFIFDEGNIVMLFNGFQKKTQKTPSKEIDRALELKKEYYAGVTALIAKRLIISPKMGFFYCAKPLKMGEMWCVLVGLGAKISKFSANF